MGLTSTSAGLKRASQATALSCWGLNHLGQASDGTTTDRDTPVQVDVSGVRQVVASSDFSALVRHDGTLFLWGNRRFGDTRYQDNYVSVPSPVLGLSGIVQVSLEAKHILALGSDGTVWAWGHNSYAELGDGTTAHRATPRNIPSLLDITQISASAQGAHALALRTDGTVLAWGHNQKGQLGMGCDTPRYVPAEVPGLTGVHSISAGENSSFAIASPAVWAWGSN
ncbi:hypothetical protein Acor_19270 [Acrocarpospora corrugata]|uniref:RCC1 repeat-containing protein n=1 Tax=Acrocarpospora corrugata TaxID=35763 RepID=A0A5M3VTM3_9ACTN|nr:hypothetical protein [Acrocarpospora corrugata]GER99863.1 hypothetical protein Acor_19270 [Acrocarpospora corrugata]